GLVSRLEGRIDHYSAQIPPIQQFILPGGCEPSSLLHSSRAVARRAERRVVTLGKRSPINDDVRRYLNRLSDLLFVMARVINARVGVADVEYRSDRT
ncbi:MAG: cob(I)yrinic acid a,c-diamide adenosyltransferase, partial [Novibacillus thermophilus]